MTIRKCRPICFNHKSGFFIKLPLIGKIHSNCFLFFAKLPEEIDVAA